MERSKNRNRPMHGYGHICHASSRICRYDSLLLELEPCYTSPEAFGRIAKPRSYALIEPRNALISVNNPLDHIWDVSLCYDV